MTNASIYQDIRTRTGGDIYIGVVGPVRTGKSTFIQKFMDTTVLPRINEPSVRERATDEMPQSAAGRTIMTTEPKFVPEQAVSVMLEENTQFRVRLIDCVGYIVPSALGYIEEDQPRMVMTPWYEEPIPFNMAAEIGTQKVITEHSTIGLVVTTDGSISDIPREEYEEAEQRVITELKEIHKPFAVLLNCTDPQSPQSLALQKQLHAAYAVPVVAVNCLALQEADILDILTKLLYEFPIRQMRFTLPGWVMELPRDHWLRSKLKEEIREHLAIRRVSEVKPLLQQLAACTYIQDARLVKMDLGTGCGEAMLTLQSDLFYQIISERCGLEIGDESVLMETLTEMAALKKKYSRLAEAYDEVLETGYGIVMPQTDELSLEEPEMIKQNGKYGIRLRAQAPSIHMMRTNICTELTPIVGSEQQSEDLILYLLKEFDESPEKIWESNMFGKTLHELVSDGLHGKLYRMPTEARTKLRETMERVINEGCNGLICIIL